MTLPMRSAPKLEHALDAAERGLPVLIPLRDRDGNVVAHAQVSPEDSELAQLRWCLRDGSYAVRMSRGHIIRLHRVVMGCTAGDGVVVDHINGDGLDCRRENLRCGTQALNSQNLRGSSRGVGWHKAAGKWRARVKLNYQEHHLGLFDSREAACEAAAAFRAQHMPFSSEAAHAV